MAPRLSPSVSTPGGRPSWAWRGWAGLALFVLLLSSCADDRADRGPFVGGPNTGAEPYAERTEVGEQESPLAQCGDGLCETTEDLATCPTDCATPTAPGEEGEDPVVDEGDCGDGTCTPVLEDCGVCPTDCPCAQGTGCSDGVCVQADPCADGSCDDPWPEYPTNPFVFDLEQAQEPGEIRGSVFVHELSGDNLMDFVVTGPGVVGVYDHMGGLLWKADEPINLPGAANNGSGYPGTHAPGAIAGDMDGDGDQEVAYLTTSGELRIHDGLSGGLETTYSFPGALALAIANLRGEGDRDAVLQYDQHQLRAVNLSTGETLWHRTDWFGVEHTQVRVADMDGDGLDEVIGPVYLDDSGDRINTWDLAADHGTSLGGLDSLGIGDIVPGGCLEIALAEQGGNNQTVVVNAAQFYWGVARDPGSIPPTGQCVTEKDPDKMAVGDFDPSRPGLEVFARSACAHHPWVHDAQGNIIATWNLPETAPSDWLVYAGGDEYGMEEIRPIDWVGGDQRHLLLKERHVEGKAAVVDAMTGAFLEVFDVNAARIYGGDIAGDYREEAIVLISGADTGRIEIYWNDAPNAEVRPRPWQVQYYRRAQQNWNYYSPSAGSPSLPDGVVPGTTCEPPDPCGDGQCAPGEEDCGTCPGDCPCPGGQVCDQHWCVPG